MLSKIVRGKTEARVSSAAIHFRGRRARYARPYVLQATQPERSYRSICPPLVQKVSESRCSSMAGREPESLRKRSRIEINRAKLLLGRQHPHDLPRHYQKKTNYALSGQRMGYFYMPGNQFQIFAANQRSSATRR